VFQRLGIRIFSSLAGIAVGLVLSAAFLGGFHISFGAVVISSLVFWAIHLIVSFIVLRLFIRQPSLALVGLLTLGSTIVSLILVNVFVNGITIHGVQAYVISTVIIWICTVGADFVGRRRIRQNRRERRGD
jgi:hypothetical protein